MLKNRILMIYIFLTIATLIAFWRVNYCDFVSYDDYAYITQNSHIQHGLTMDGIRWAFTTGYQANWHPVTWISHMLDIQLFGLNPAWHHRMNLLFHIANTLLLFFIFNRMTKAPWKSAFVAALFALHPLHVESVTWASERKDVVSTFFWILTMIAYYYYVQRPGLRKYLPVLFLYFLGLMAKPMLVTLPFILMLLDFWPLQRVGREHEQTIQAKCIDPMSPKKRQGKSRKKKGNTTKDDVKTKKSKSSKYQWAFLMRPLLLEKIPLFALTAFSCVITYIAQQKWGSVEVLPLSLRIGNAFISYITYIGKMILPNRLAFFYPYRVPQLWQILGAVLILTAITLMVIRVAQKFQFLMVGWLWYMGTLVPVIGFVQVGEQAEADRYTYIPLLGLFIIVAWGIPKLLGNWRYRKEALIASSTLALSCCFIATWTQVGYWQNNFTLFDHAIQVTNNNYVAYDSLGTAFKVSGDYKQAIADYNRALEIAPKYASAYYNRGIVYEALGYQRLAIADYDRAIEINPKFIDAYTTRGNAYAALGKPKMAIMDFDRAIEINPKDAGAYNSRGNAYTALGKPKMAIMDFDRAIEINPNNAALYLNHGNAYAALGDQNQAIMDYNKAIEIDPKLALAYTNRGNTYAALGNYKQAINDYDRTIEINPKLALAYRDRAVSYLRLGYQERAIDDLKAAAMLGDKLAQNFLHSKGISW